MLATVSVLATGGPDALRIEDVAKRAGVATASVARRWPNPGALIGAALSSLRSGAETVPIPQRGTLRADLMEVARQARDRLRSMEGRALARVLYASRERPELFALAMSIEGARQTALRLVVEAAAARGEIAKDADVTALVEVVSATLRDRLFLRGEDADDRFVGRLVDFALRAIGARVKSEAAKTRAPHRKVALRKRARSG
jgi:AcrR family transcriptional regulator